MVELQWYGLCIRALALPEHPVRICRTREQGQDHEEPIVQDLRGNLTDGPAVELEHIHHPHVGQAAAEEVRPLLARRGHQETPVGPSLDGDAAGGGVALGREELGAGGKVVKDVLLVPEGLKGNGRKDDGKCRSFKGIQGGFGGCRMRM